MVSLRIVILLVASFVVLSNTLSTPPTGNIQRRLVRSADDLKTSASYGYGYGYGYPYGGYGWGGYGGWGYGYPYYAGYSGLYHGYPGYGYGFYGGYGYPGFWH